MNASALRSPRLFHRAFSAFVLSALLLTCWIAVAPRQLAAQAEQPLRIAVVGLKHGHITGFLRALPEHSNVQLVGIAEDDTTLWAQYERQFSLPHTLFYKSEANMIERTHPQAVVVYTPISEHRPAIAIAAQYGVSVMVEKPLTISIEDARAIRETARQYKIHVLVNYETTWYASNRMAFDQAEHGQLGPIRRVVIHDGHNGPKEIGVQPEFLKWLSDPAQNGAGALYDFGCYGADLATWLMHGEAPLTVTAVANHDKPEIYPRVDDDATIILQYPKAQVVIQASWNWPFGRKDMEVYGASGYAITVGADQVRLRLQHNRQEQLTTAPALIGPDGNSLDYLAAVLAGYVKDQGNLSALDTNVTVVQILDAARESARTGHAVSLHGKP
jgi:predicted dehydrogenase